MQNALLSYILATAQIQNRIRHHYYKANTMLDILIFLIQVISECDGEFNKGSLQLTVNIRLNSPNNWSPLGPQWLLKNVVETLQTGKTTLRPLEAFRIQEGVWLVLRVIFVVLSFNPNNPALKLSQQQILSSGYVLLRSCKFKKKFFWNRNITK